MLNHKTYHIAFKIIKIIQTIFSYLYRFKSEVSSRKNSRKFPSIQKLNNSVRNNPVEITKEIRKHFYLNENEK